MKRVKYQIYLKQKVNIDELNKSLNKITSQNGKLADEFVKLTLSKPIRKSEGLLNVYLRLVVIDGKLEDRYL